MIKMRIEFYKDKELEEASKILADKLNVWGDVNFEIIDRSKVTNSKKEFNKMRLIHLELVKK